MKWICKVCGYVHEGDAAPEFCPQCKQPASKFKEVVEGEALTWADEHVIGVAKGVDEEVFEGLRAHFAGECSEVGCKRLPGASGATLRCRPCTGEARHGCFGDAAALRRTAPL